MPGWISSDHTVPVPPPLRVTSSPVRSGRNSSISRPRTSRSAPGEAPCGTASFVDDAGEVGHQQVAAALDVAAQVRGRRPRRSGTARARRPRRSRTGRLPGGRSRRVRCRFQRPRRRPRARSRGSRSSLGRHSRFCAQKDSSPRGRATGVDGGCRGSRPRAPEVGAEFDDLAPHPGSGVRRAGASRSGTSRRRTGTAATGRT